MEVVQLDAQVRETLGKTASKKFRNNGQVPCVIYGLNKETLHVAVDAQALTKAYKGEHRYNVVLDLKIGGQTEQVISYVVSRDAISQKITHVDFIRVTMDTPVKVTVPLVFEGMSPGVKKGGSLTKKRSEIRVNMPPKSIPAKVVIDLGTLDLGAKLVVKDLEQTHGLTIAANDDDIIARVDRGRAGAGASADAEAAA